MITEFEPRRTKTDRQWAHFNHQPTINYRPHEQQTRSTFLLDIVQIASSSLCLDEVLCRLAKSIANAVGVPYCGFFLVDEASDTVTPKFQVTVQPIYTVCVERDLPRQVPSRSISTFSTFIAQIVAQKLPLTCDDVQHDPRFDNSTPRTLGMKSILGMPILVQRRVVAVAYAFTLNDYCSFTAEQVELMWAIANTVGLAIENSRLYEESRERLRESESLQRVTSMLLKEIDFDKVLEIICAEAQQLTDAKGSTILLCEDETWLRVACKTGESPAYTRLPITGSLAGNAVRQRQPILNNHPAHADQIDIGAPISTAQLAVPLLVQGKPIGVLNVVGKPEGFSQCDVRIISILANQAAIAIDRAQLYQQVEQLVVTEERARIAREMHDNLAQALATLNLKLSLTSELLITPYQVETPEIAAPEIATHKIATHKIVEVQNNLREMKEIVAEAYTDTREAILSLRTATTAGENFLLSLRGYLAKLRASYGVEVQLVVDDSVSVALTMPTAIQLIRIIQEALTNVRKHAHASNAWVRLTVEGAGLYITVEDNGRGFDPMQAMKNALCSFGLQVMQERAERVGGCLTVDSFPGGGTRIMVWAPLAPEA